MTQEQFKILHDWMVMVEDAVFSRFPSDWEKTELRRLRRNLQFSMEDSRDGAEAQGG